MYAPPRSEVAVPLDEARRRRVEQLLIMAGGALVGATAVLSGKLGAVTKVSTLVMWCGLCPAFVYGGRRWQLGIAILMVGSLVMLGHHAVSSMEMAERTGVPLDGSFWRRLGVAMPANVVTIVCGVALFVRGRSAGRR